MATRSKRRFPTPVVSLTRHPATLPIANVPDNVDHASVVTSALMSLSSGLLEESLTKNAIWRDTLALTGTLRTFFGQGLVAKVWRGLSCKHKVTRLQLIPESSKVIRLGPETSWVDARFSFELQGERPARCSGIIGLVPDAEDDNSWKIGLLCTILEQPDGWPDVDHLEPVNGYEAGNRINGAIKATSSECALDERLSCSKILDCLVVGAGMAGLCMAARLKALGLSYLVVEKHEKVGDFWLQERYDSVKLHTSKEYSQMPYYPQTFGPDKPYNLTGRDLAEGFQGFAQTFGIAVSTSTMIESAEWVASNKCWSLSVKCKGKAHSISARHVVLAVGNNGIIPKMPAYANKDVFKGDVLHSRDYHDSLRWKGKRGIVIGSANTAHDVVADMCKANLNSVTMIQRSKTWVMPSSTFATLVDPVYNTETLLETSDRTLLGYPLPIQRLLGKTGIQMCAESRPDYFDRFEANGFNLERHGDLWGLMYDREGGHLFDTGNGEFIANGQVKMVNDVEPVAYTESGLQLSDGRRLDVDVIVFATGYNGSHIKDTASKIFGSEIGNSLEDFWQCDKEGESRGAWKDTGHPRIWYTGHGFAHARYYSRFVAMHIKADVDGKPMEMYVDTPEV